MSNNSFGSLFKLSSFGESHGPGLGALVEGCPSGVLWQQDYIDDFILRRKPGQSKVTSPRKESDDIEVLSGIFEGKTLGTPIAVIVRNTNQISKEYDRIEKEPRAGHSDDLWKKKYLNYDPRGGGRSSGRETVSRVIAGAIAKMFCVQVKNDISVDSKIVSYGPHKFESWNKLEVDLLKIKDENDSYGGVCQITINASPALLGQPVFKKLKSDLAQGFMSVGAINGFDFGGGFETSHLIGSEFHNEFNSSIYGGVRGGLSTGHKIEMRASFKPTSSIGQWSREGRHDPCVMLRGLVVLESMCWLVLADHILLNRLDNI